MDSEPKTNPAKGLAEHLTHSTANTIYIPNMIKMMFSPIYFQPLKMETLYKTG